MKSRPSDQGIFANNTNATPISQEETEQKRKADEKKERDAYIARIEWDHHPRNFTRGRK